MPCRSRLALLLTSLACLAALVATPAASAADDPNHVGFTLEGCRLLSTTELPQTTGPNAGKFICNDTEYTTGNLGKNWNELDLVPFRITADSNGPAQTYAVVIALDHKDAGAPGYDVISAPQLNLAKSTSAAACQLSPSVQDDTTGINGIDETIYRTLTITQAAGADCVWDYYGRLALGSHLFPGSALHANLLNQSLGSAGIGSKDVSIPVNEILPQELSKTMQAQQGTGYTWAINKSVPTSASFGNTCGKSGTDLERNVAITVSWTRTVVNGNIVVTTQIKATNPAHRTITVDVTDRIYGGTTASGPVLDEAEALDVDVPANRTDFLVLTHTKEFPAGSYTAFNDVATATYEDKETGIEVPGQTTATATAPVTSIPSSNNGTATISDSESITGTGLQFSIGSTSGQMGTFGGGYVLGTPTTATTWSASGVSASGSVTFNKTIHLASPQATTGFLDDTATLDDGSGTPLSSGLKRIPIDATRDCGTVKIVKRTIPAGAAGTFEFTRNVTRESGALTTNVSLQDAGVDTITDVVPNAGGTAYTAGEDLTAQGQPSGFNLTAIDCFTTDGTTPDTDSGGAPNGAKTSGTASIHVSAGETVTCRFTNTQRATMIVRKETNPPTNTGPSFPFTTNAPGASGFSLAHGAEEPRSVTPGAYTAGETNPTDPAAGYRLQSISCEDDGTGADDSTGNVATGVASYNLSAGETVRCTFINRLESSAINVVKDGPATVYHGDKATFTYVVTNPGEQSIHDVVVTDDKCSPVTSTGKTEGANNTGVDILDPGDTWNYKCTMTMGPHSSGEQDPHVNLATVTGKDERNQPVSDTDPHSTKLLHPGIALTKDGPAEVNAGQNIVYTLVVANTGDTSMAQANVNFSDPRCDLVAPERTGTGGDASPGSFDPRDAWTFTCTASTAIGETEVTNVADVCGTDTGGKTVCARDDAVTIVRQPIQQVEPQRAQPGSARLAGPTRCVRGPFALRISGQQIESVTVFVGSRRVARRSGAGSLSIDPRKVGYAVQRVRVVVRFNAASGTAAKTIRATFQRCPRKVFRPKFTG